MVPGQFYPFGLGLTFSSSGAIAGPRSFRAPGLLLGCVKILQATSFRRLSRVNCGVFGMWYQDCQLSAAELIELRDRMRSLSDDLQALCEDIAESESRTAYCQPGPFCGYVSQARNALGLSAAAVNEVLLRRDCSEAAGAEGAAEKRPGSAAYEDEVEYLREPDPAAFACSPNLPPADAERKVTAHLA